MANVSDARGERHLEDRLVEDGERVRVEREGQGLRESLTRHHRVRHGERQNIESGLHRDARPSEHGIVAGRVSRRRAASVGRSAKEEAASIVDQRVYVERSRGVDCCRERQCFLRNTLKEKRPGAAGGRGTLGRRGTKMNSSNLNTFPRSYENKSLNERAEEQYGGLIGAEAGVRQRQVHQPRRRRDRTHRGQPWRRVRHA